jgi:ribosomal protein S18 acetylase RimI-like enzyme
MECLHALPHSRRSFASYILLICSMVNISIGDLSNLVHAQAMLTLLNEYSQDKMGGGSELSDFVKSNLVQALKKRPGVYVILAFDGEKPIGLAICMEGFSTFACMPLLNIHDIVVSKEYRGRGISKKLLAKAEEIALNTGCCKLTLEVLEGNSVAQAAYMAAGYAGYELNPAIGKALFWQKKLI